MNETENIELTVPEKIKLLKKWTQDQSLMQDLSERELRLFLHSCDYIVDDTKKTLVSYYELRIRSPEIFTNRDPKSKEIVSASTYGYTILLPGATEDGFKVILSGYWHSDTTNFVFLDMNKRYLMAMDMWLSEIDNCPGIIVLIDCKNSAIGHVTAASLDVLKVLVSYFQEAFPVKLVGFYFINMSSATSLLLSLVQPFLSKKITNMIHKIPKGSETLFSVIPREILPSNYGGDAATIQQLHEAVVQQLNDHAEWFRQEDEKINRLIEKNATLLKNNSIDKSLD